MVSSRMNAWRRGAPAFLATLLLVGLRSAVSMALVIVTGEKGSATGHIEQGRYKVENVPLGEVKIAVNTDAAKGQMISQQMAQGYKGPDSKGVSKPAVRFLDMPEKFREPETSGITTTIKKGANTFDIVLTK